MYGVSVQNCQLIFTDNSYDFDDIFMNTNDCIE